MSALFLGMFIASGQVSPRNAFPAWLEIHAGPFEMLIYPADFGLIDFWPFLLLSIGLIAPRFRWNNRWTKASCAIGVAIWFLAGWAVLLAGY